MSETNRRKHTRVKPKQLATRVQSGGALHIGLAVENISLGGLFVRSNTPLKIGAAVKLELQRPGASLPLPLTGRVTTSVTAAAAAERNKPPGMGIAFDPLPPHLVPRLDGLIASIDPNALEVEATLEDRGVIELMPADRLQKEIELLKGEVLKRNRKIAELTEENAKLRAKLAGRY